MDGTWFVVGQSLAQADHVESDLTALEVVAGLVLLLGVFLGTLMIGIKAASPVEQARRRQLEFTADASHELRTPFSVIEAEVSLALSSPRTIPDYRDTLGRVSGRHSGSVTSSKTSCGSPASIRSHHLQATNRSMSVRSPLRAPTVLMPLPLVEVFRFHCGNWVRGSLGSMPLPNGSIGFAGVLVDNACRYAGENGVVDITVHAQGNRVSLTVEDSGPGIAPEERDSLFDRFHRATDEGNGAGLGLAIGDAVVRATGGEWRVGVASLGGALMEVRWHRSSAAKGSVDQPQWDRGTPSLDPSRSGESVPG